ncbi:hypothetical protein ACFQX7_04665 [Luedemannella flava]
MYRLIVTPVGPFGHAVAERLRDLRRDVSVEVEIEVDGPDPVLRVLAAWRRVPALERDLDEESHRSAARGCR